MTQPESKRSPSADDRAAYGTETIKILSGGAANGLVRRLEARFYRETGLSTDGDYGAVGGMVERIRGGEAVDLMILTKANIDDLTASGHVLAESARHIGRVATGISVNQGQPIPSIADSASLHRTLSAASALYVPDTRQSTAGRHILSVLGALGLAQTMQGRLREFKNGLTAMQQMALDDVPGALGCTQITEIVATPGVVYAGDLPGEHGLSTTYTAAVSSAATRPAEATIFISILTDPAEADTRRDSGFSTIGQHIEESAKI